MFFMTVFNIAMCFVRKAICHSSPSQYITIYHIVTPVSWYASYRHILGSTQPYLLPPAGPWIPVWKPCTRLCVDLKALLLTAQEPILLISKWPKICPGITNQGFIKTPKSKVWTLYKLTESTLLKWFKNNEYKFKLCEQRSSGGFHKLVHIQNSILIGQNTTADEHHKTAEETPNMSYNPFNKKSKQYTKNEILNRSSHILRAVPSHHF